MSEIEVTSLDFDSPATAPHRVTEVISIVALKTTYEDVVHSIEFADSWSIPT